MKIGERGQVTIPKEIRERFGLGPETQVEFRIVRGKIVLRKKSPKLDLKKWKGRCKGNLGLSVDEFIEAIRGR